VVVPRGYRQNLTDDFMQETRTRITGTTDRYLNCTRTEQNTVTGHVTSSAKFQEIIL
jgi:hypothetical protein